MSTWTTPCIAISGGPNSSSSASAAPPSSCGASVGFWPRSKTDNFGGLSVFDELLELQSHDTLVDQLRHKLDALPERADLLAREATLADVDRQLAELSPQQGDIGAQQKRFEDELASVEEKIKEVDGQLYSGTVTSTRELLALQADVDSLKRRRSTLEDQLLEAMAEAEPLDEESTKLLDRRRQLEGEIEGLQAAVDVASGGIGTELQGEEDARAKVAASLPPQLLSLYETLRTKLGGVGAARLVGGACGGCHMKLPAIELDAIKHQAVEAVVRCDQCGRILVR